MATGRLLSCSVLLIIGYFQSAGGADSMEFCPNRETGSYKLESGESIKEVESKLISLRNTWADQPSALRNEDMDWLFERMRMMIKSLNQKEYTESIGTETPECRKSDTELKSKYTEKANDRNQAEIMKNTEADSSESVENSHGPMHLAVVACGDRLEETMVMIKSALLFSRAMLHLYIFADNDLQPLFKEQLEQLPYEIQKRSSIHIHDISFPEGQKPDEWRKVFKTCSTQRLFLPDLLLGVRRLLYVDTDILFMTPVETIWDFFYNFNSTHLAALSWEHESGNAGWYNRFARHPYYPPFGVNSGVMLMDLELMRQASWVDRMVQYYKEYKYMITWGDQDLINIFFHHYPEKLYVFRCQYNYRPDHCMYMQNCKPAAESGVYIVHGSRGVYHNEKQVTFRAIYNTFKEYEFGKPLKTQLLKKMVQALDETVGSKDRCASSRELFTKVLEGTIRQSSGNSEPGV